MFMSVNPVTLKRELRSVKEQIEDLLKPAVADAPARLVLIRPDTPANSGLCLEVATTLPCERLPICGTTAGTNAADEYGPQYHDSLERNLWKTS